MLLFREEFLGLTETPSETLEVDTGAAIP